MTDSAHPVCDCPEHSSCYVEGYAQGKDKAYSEVLTSLDGPATPWPAPAGPAE